MRSVTPTENLLDTPFPEIADKIVRDTAELARLEAETAEYERAVELLRPYMQDFPDRTVHEALELLRADQAAANQHQAAPQAQTLLLLPAPTWIQVTRETGKSRGDDLWVRIDCATASDLQAQVRLGRRGSFRRTWTEGVLAQYGEQLTEGVQLGDVWPDLRGAVTNHVEAATGVERQERTSD